MILVDFTGLIFQFTHSVIKMNNLQLNENEEYNSEEIVHSLKTCLLNELFNIDNTYKDNKIVLCVDNTVQGNWRKLIYKSYKHSRAEEKTHIPFKDIFADINKLLTELKNNTYYNVVCVEHAEADDCILTLSDRYARLENITIISSDKDMIQAQRNENVRQYSPILKKFITYKTKGYDNMNEWLYEHVILGDVSDDIPRIFDETEYTTEFIDFLNNNNINTDVNLFSSIDSDVLNRFNGEIWKKLRIGPKTILKMIKDNTVNDFIKKYHSNYERNKKLILSEYIPDNIKQQIYTCIENEMNKTYDTDKFMKYLSDEKLDNVMYNVPTRFRTRTVTLDDFI